MISILNGFSHIGYFKEAIEMYYSMEKLFGIKPIINHQVCIVDALSRGGKLDEAEEFVKNEVKDQDNIIIWKVLLSACRNNCDVKRGERIFERAIQIDPKDASIYVLMWNLYRIGNFFEKSLEISEMMKKQGIKKIPEQSWGYMNGKLIVFVANDKSQKNWREIQENS